MADKVETKPSPGDEYPKLWFHPKDGKAIIHEETGCLLQPGVNHIPAQEVYDKIVRSKLPSVFTEPQDDKKGKKK